MSSQSFTIDQLAAQFDEGYREFLRRPGMSIGLYRIPIDGADHQHPHASDEVYIVQRGQAQLDVEGTEIPVGPGRVISVDRGREHHFTKITEDLEIIVVFAPPEVPE
jgi:mannose-6-phosphate isomerase-like protein (cupin superfamily)